jgi:hypothetical protein
VSTTTEVTRKVVTAFDLVAPEVAYAEEHVWGELIRNLPENQPRLLARSVADAVPVVAVMLPEDRSLMLTRLIIAFDVVESVGALAYVAESRQSADAAIAAAAMASSPGVAESLFDRIAKLADVVPLSPRQRTIFDVMLSPSAEPLTSAARTVRETRWPGVLTDDPPAPLVLVEETSATPAAAMWRLIGELHAAGAVVRRTFDQAPRPVPTEFLHPQHVSVGWHERSIAGISPSRYLRMPAELFDESLLLATLEEISAATNEDQRRPLRLDSAPRYCRIQARPSSGPSAVSDFRLRRQVGLVRQAAYEAVVSYVDELGMEGVQLELLMELGLENASTLDEQFARVIAEGLAPSETNPLQRAAHDGVRAAISELLAQQRVRYDPTSHSAVIQRIP